MHTASKNSNAFLNIEKFMTSRTVVALVDKIIIWTIGLLSGSLAHIVLTIYMAETGMLTRFVLPPRARATTFPPISNLVAC